MKHCVSARRSLSLHIYLCISWETVYSMLHLLQRGIRVPMKSYLPCATNTFRKARAWPRWAAFYSSAPPESQVYCGKDDTPLVRTEYLSDKRIWILHMLAQETPDNRLTHTFIEHGLLPALRDVRMHWASWVKESNTADGAALVTTAPMDNKIFSNGLDLINALRDPHFFNDHLNKLFRELLTFPIPTVASVGGHAFAAGFTLALAHDYRVMNSERGYLCMNEIEFGAPIPKGMLGVITSVARQPSLQRKIVLEGHRFTAPEALEQGLIDATSKGQQGTLDVAVALADRLRSRCAKNAWQAIRELLKEEAILSQYEPPKAHISVSI